MAASTITRASWTDGASGTIIDNARKNTDIYDPIDQMFAGAGSYATFTLGGKLAVEGFGTHTWSAGGTGANKFTLRNTSAGTANYAEYALGNDTSATAAYFGVLASTYTISTIFQPDGAYLAATLAGGLSIGATHTSGVIRFFAGGGTERGRIDANGLIDWGAVGGHSFSGSTTSFNAFGVRNTNTGTAAYAELRVGNSASATQTVLGQLSTGYTTAGLFVQNGAYLQCVGAGGLSIIASDASGAIRFASGGTTLRASFNTSGHFVPNGSGAYNLGDNSNQWFKLWLTPTAAASLPAAGAAQDGTIMINSTDGRLIFYSAGNRYYIVGSTF